VKTDFAILAPDFNPWAGCRFLFRITIALCFWLKTYRSVMVFEPRQQPELYQGRDRVPVLENINVDLTVEQIFTWLKMR